MESFLVPKHLFVFLAAHGVTQAAIAAQLGVSPQLVNSWSVGRRHIPLKRYSQLLAFAVERAKATLKPTTPVSTPLDRATRQLVRTYLQGLRSIYDERRQIAALHAHHVTERIEVLANWARTHPATTWTAEDVGICV